MRIGHSTIPRTRMPALLKGNFVVFDLASLQGQWGIICDLPQIEFCEAVFLNQFHRTVKRAGATLLGMLPYTDPWVESQLPKAKVLCIPLLADPLGRLHRVLGLSKESLSSKCQSFIFDPEGVVRYHLVHSLNWRGMFFLVEILKHCQDLYSQPTRQLADHPSTPLPMISEQFQGIQTMLRTSPTLLPHHMGGYYATE